MIKTLAVGMLIASASYVFATATEKEQQAANQVVQLLQQQDSLRVDREGEKAWINPVLWLRMNAQQKEFTTRMIAIYISAQYPSVTLYDSQSARELASFGPFQGFKVY